MKNWILIIDSLNGILSDSIANKEIAYTCNDASKIMQGDRLLGYISAPIGEIRMLLTATKGGNGTTLFLEKIFEISSGCKVNEDLYDQVLATSSTENKCIEISEESFNDMAHNIFESVNMQKQLLLNDRIFMSDDWYSIPATEHEYNTFKKLLNYFVEQLNINNGLVEGNKKFANGGTLRSTELIKEWNKYNGFELSCRFARGYQLIQDNAHYINYAWVNINPHFDKDTKYCTSLSINVKPKMNVLYKGENYLVEDLDLKSDDSANVAVKTMFDELRQQIYNWQQGIYNIENVDINANEQKEKFKNWLISQKKSNGELYSANTIYSYIHQMESAYECFAKYKDYESVFQIKNVNELNEYMEYLFTADGFEDFNLKAGNKACSCGLLKYKEFIVDSESFDYKGTKGEAINKIFFGTPGCGKSYHIEHKILGKDEKTKEYVGEYDKDNIIRTTFYQDYSNTDFVGQILPKIEKDTSTGKEIVKYIFNPGPFTLAFIRAISNPQNKVALVIEEINRGNAPAIFGDIFQLLDRDENSISEYGIVNVNLIDYLNNYTFIVDGEEKQYNFKEIKLPGNLDIFATMNTSDQNVYTLDTAFTRRWEKEKIENSFEDCGFHGAKVPGMNCDWEHFVTAINNHIDEHLEDLQINEDKKIGVFFVKESLLSSNDPKKFAYKVFDYLWNDVAKLDHDIFFNQYKTLDKLIADYSKKGINVFNTNIVNLLNVSPAEEKEENDEE